MKGKDMFDRMIWRRIWPIIALVVAGSYLVLTLAVAR